MDRKESLIRIVLLSLLLYAAISLASSGEELRQALDRQRALEAELDALNAARREMQQELEREISEEELEQLARQRLGLVRPGEKIFYFTTDREG